MVLLFPSGVAFGPNGVVGGTRKTNSVTQIRYTYMDFSITFMLKTAVLARRGVHSHAGYQFRSSKWGLLQLAQVEHRQKGFVGYIYQPTVLCTLNNPAKWSTVCLNLVEIVLWTSNRSPRILTTRFPAKCIERERCHAAKGLPSKEVLRIVGGNALSGGCREKNLGRVVRGCRE